MKISDKIYDLIVAHRSQTGQDPSLVLLSPAAYRRLRDEAGSFHVANADPATTPSSMHGIPFKVLEDEPGERVGTFGGI